MAPLGTCSHPALSELQIRGQVASHGGNVTADSSNYVSASTPYSPGLTVAAALGGFMVVVFVIGFLWMLGIFARSKKAQGCDCPQNRRTLDAVCKPISRQAWRSTLRNQDSSVPQYVINQDSCAICLEPVEDTDHIRPLPCNHVFHQNCFDSWFWQAEQPNKCPLCRREFLDWPKWPRKPVALHLVPHMV